MKISFAIRNTGFLIFPLTKKSWKTGRVAASQGATEPREEAKVTGIQVHFSKLALVSEAHQGRICASLYLTTKEKEMEQSMLKLRVILSKQTVTLLFLYFYVQPMSK